MEVFDLRKSTRKNKKYMADVKINGILHKNVHFGSLNYEQYKDSTPLKLYSNLDHNNLKRRELFHIRHQHNHGPAAMLSKEFLW
jgi:hypothetical protein